MFCQQKWRIKHSIRSQTYHSLTSIATQILTSLSQYAKKSQNGHQ